MKNLKKVLLCFGMAAFLAGGVGTAIALTRTGANKSGSGKFDSAISLYWDTDQTTHTLDPMPGLKALVPQFRYLSVSPKSTKSVAGTVTLTFTLKLGTVTTGTAVMTGLSVDVYKTASLATDDTVGTLIDGVTPEPTLSVKNEVLTGTTSFAVEASSSAHETKAYYAIKVTYDGSEIKSDEVLAAQLEISQDFALSK